MFCSSLPLDKSLAYKIMYLEKIDSPKDLVEINVLLQPSAGYKLSLLSELCIESVKLKKVRKLIVAVMLKIISSYTILLLKLTN